MDRKIIIILSLIIMGVLFIIIGVGIEFYNDYQCSNTDDINWFIDNNCMRFVR